MAEHGYAVATIRLTLCLLKRVLTFGQRRGVVVRNVADLAQPPAAPTKPRDAGPNSSAFWLRDRHSHDVIGG